MQIRPETWQDVDAITALTAAAFLHAPHSSHTEHFIVNALRAAGQLSVSLVAVDAGRVLGHVAVSPVTVSDGSAAWYGLGPISVLPGHQGQGIGSALMQHALVALHAKGAAGCVLLGEPGYYQRFGFAAQPGLVLDGVPPEYFMALRLAGPMALGRVQYHAAFDAQS